MDMHNIDPSNLSRKEIEELYNLVEAQEQRLLYNKVSTYLPDDGPFSRDKYSKHLQFFEAGATYTERVLFGANRAGKSEAGAHELYYHASGEYPNWWKGKRFNRPIIAWAIGVDNLVVRDTIQKKLMGTRGDEGSGIIPKRLFEPEGTGNWTTKAGVPGSCQDIFIPHVSGGRSQIVLKSYEQEMKSFMGTAIDVVWFDEEPPRDIYDECLMRLATTKGILFCTFTPLKGFSSVVKEFLPDNVFPDDCIVRVPNSKQSKWVIRIELNDVPHVDQQFKDQLEASLQPHMREARMKGIPCVGIGKVYPVPESDFIIAPFEVPMHWDRVYGLDVGWRNTAAVFGAYDRQKDIFYIYDEYCVEEVRAALVAASIKRKGGDWIPGLVDPSSNRRNPNDGIRIMNEYEEEGLNLYKADNAVRAGITNVYSRLISGRLKIMHNCQALIGELRGYAYDDQGNIAGKSKGRAKDHACDALRYLIKTGAQYAVQKEDPDEYRNYQRYSLDAGRDPITGY